MPIACTGRTGDRYGGAIAASLESVFLIAVLGLPLLVIWVWALVDAVRNPGFAPVARAAWVAIVVILPLLGALLYVAIPGRHRLRLGR